MGLVARILTRSTPSNTNVLGSKPERIKVCSTSESPTVPRNETRRSMQLKGNSAAKQMNIASA